MEKLWNKSFVSPGGNLLVSSCIASASAMSCSLVKKMFWSMTVSLAACRGLTPAWFDWSKTVQSSRPQTFSLLWEPKQNGVQSSHNVTKGDCMIVGSVLSTGMSHLEPNGKGVFSGPQKPWILVKKWPKCTFNIWDQKSVNLGRKCAISRRYSTLCFLSQTNLGSGCWNKGKHGTNLFELRKS